MRLLRHALIFFAIIGATAFARADTIKFTATVTSQNGLYAVPIGSVYTGFVHFDGPYDMGDLPLVTSYGFTYPSAPASIAGLNYVFTQRQTSSSPLQVNLGYVDFSGPAASFDLVNNFFTIFTPISESKNGYSFSYSVYESGTVSYTYLTDPPASSTPEPTSLILVATGVIATCKLKRRNLQSHFIK